MNSQEHYKASLKKGVFFKGLSEEHLNIIASLATTVDFRRNKIIAEEGDEANEFYIIRKGYIAVETARPQMTAIVFQELGVGEVCGWSWLIPPYRWTFNLRAIEDTTVLLIDGKQLRKLCEQEPSLGYQLIKRLSRIMVMRLHETRQRLLDCYKKGFGEERMIF